jgi:uncharacterized Tic20 family protein
MSDNETQAPPPIEPAPPIKPPTGSPPPLPPDEARARTWNMFCHLSALTGFIGVPLGNILGPLLVWQIKKHEIPSVEVHGKAALNFQLTVLIAVLVGAAAGFLLSFFCIGFLLFPIVIVIALCGLIFPIIAGIQANDGKNYKYPYSIEFLK